MCEECAEIRTHAFGWRYVRGDNYLIVLNVGALGFGRFLCVRYRRGGGVIAWVLCGFGVCIVWWGEYVFR